MQRVLVQEVAEEGVGGVEEGGNEARGMRSGMRTIMILLLMKIRGLGWRRKRACGRWGLGWRISGGEVMEMKGEMS